jgi:HlyD family secretion protein
LALSLVSCGKGDDRSYSGYIEGEYVYLASPLAGYLDKLQVTRGSRVAEGAAIFAVAADPEQQGLNEAEAMELAAHEKVRNLSEPRRKSEVATMEAQLRVAEAALRLSARQMQQQESLFVKGFISSARLDEAREARARDAAQVESARQQLLTFRSTLGRQPEVRAAEAEVKAARAQVEQKRWQVDKKMVVAPTAGEISETYFRVGEWVPAGAAVASLLPDMRRRLRFYIPETIIAGIKPGQKVEATCDGCTVPIRATVDFIAPQAEYTPPVIYSRGSREKLVFRVEAVPDQEQAPTLRPGLPVEVRLVEP